MLLVDWGYRVRAVGVGIPPPTVTALDAELGFVALRYWTAVIDGFALSVKHSAYPLVAVTSYRPLFTVPDDAHARLLLADHALVLQCQPGRTLAIVRLIEYNDQCSTRTYSIQATIVLLDCITWGEGGADAGGVR